MIGLLYLKWHLELVDRAGRSASGTPALQETIRRFETLVHASMK
jgi:hypothetical protein